MRTAHALLGLLCILTAVCRIPGRRDGRYGLRPKSRREANDDGTIGIVWDYVEPPFFLGSSLIVVWFWVFPLPLDSCLFLRRLALLEYSATRGLFLPGRQATTHLASPPA